MGGGRARRAHARGRGPRRARRAPPDPAHRAGRLLRGDALGPRGPRRSRPSRSSTPTATAWPGTVGIVLASVLGTSDDARAMPAAAALGIAMQRTNILRDLDEDAAAGRTYLARATVDRFGAPRPGAREGLLRDQIARADARYEEGLAGVALLRSGRVAVRAAGWMYREILREIERDGYGARAGRAVVARRRKLWLLVRRGPAIGRSAAARRGVAWRRARHRDPASDARRLRPAAAHRGRRHRGGAGADPRDRGRVLGRWRNGGDGRRRGGAAAGARRRPSCRAAAARCCPTSASSGSTARPSPTSSGRSGSARPTPPPIG